MSIIIIAVLAIILTIIFGLLYAERKSKEATLEELLRVFYEQGFTDRRQGKPAQNWEAVPFMVENRVSKVMMGGLVSSYHEGYMDADKNAYDLNGKISKLKKTIFDGFEELNKVVNRSVNI